MAAPKPQFGVAAADGRLRVVRELDELRSGLDQYRAGDQHIALVPTMGNLHAGHMALVQDARKRADLVIATIFVNPFQFAPNEDFDTYPRTFDSDIAQLADNGCDVVFAPDGNDVYPRGPETITRVSVPELGDILCGASRPGFFRGVATVVSILLNMVQPHVAVFGEKDYQQLLIIRRMVADLRMRVAIESVATVREADGLAMSSRNGYLSAEERASAPALFRTLSDARDGLLAGGRGFGELRAQAFEQLRQAGFEPDYFELKQRADLSPVLADDVAGNNELILLAAASLGSARLIDNLAV